MFHMAYIRTKHNCYMELINQESNTTLWKDTTIYITSLPQIAANANKDT
jgi:hypothetical protein